MGNFAVKYSSLTKTGPVTLELKEGKYTCSRNIDRFPAGGSGTYTSKNGIVTFNDQNAWTADFDGNLILSGQYKYSFNGTKLTISVNKNNVGHYEYSLELVPVPN
jgi:hypothetical protein